MTEHATPQNTDPVAWLDKRGRYWSKGKTGPLRSASAFDSYGTVAELVQDHGPLTELYAHPPVAAEPAPACSDWPGACQHTPAHDNGKLTPEYKEEIPADAVPAPRIDMYEPEDGVAEIDGVLWVPSKDLDAMREEEEAAAAAQQDRLEALRRSQEFIAVQEPETRVSASLLLSSVRWVLTGQVDD